jgi:hypothetical protein
MSQLMASLATLAELSGQTIATDIINFMAPVSAVIIGVIGLKYLFGDQRSLAGFIGFLFLGIGVFALIKWGDSILESLGGIFRSWVAKDSATSDVVFTVVLIFLGVLVVVGIVSVVVSMRRQDDSSHSAKTVIDVEMEVVVVPARPDYTEATLVALRDFVPTDLSAVDRLRNQVRLAVIVAEERGLFEEGSPVTPAHLAKWVVLSDMWPEEVDALDRDPDLVQRLETEPFADALKSRELFEFLRTEPALHPVVRNLLQMSPVVEQG